MSYVNWNNVVFDENNKKLVLINDNLKEIPTAVLNRYSDRISHLDLSFNSINSLNWLKLFPNLQTLILDSNEITDEMLLKNFHHLKLSQTNLKTLSLNNNNLKDFKIIINLLAVKFPNLEYLSLHKNPMCPDGLTNYTNNDELSYQFYRNEIINLFPKLNFLDHTKIKRSFVGSIINRNTTILKFSPKMLFAKLNISNKKKMYTPLPNNYRTAGDHCGIFGLATYEYVGKHSEGNRFISNNDL